MKNQLKHVFTKDEIVNILSSVEFSFNKAKLNFTEKDKFNYESIKLKLINLYKEMI